MEKDLLEIQNMVFKSRPALKDILGQNGDFKLKDYVQKYWQVPAVEPSAEFLLSFKNVAEKIYGDELAAKALNQLKQKPLVSTIDHHGIWGHPFFVNSSLIYSLHFKQEELAIVMPTESVSLNNTTSWSGSLLKHEGSKINRYSFFPDKLKTLPVFSMPAILKNNLDRLLSSLPKETAELVKVLELENNLNAPSFAIQAASLSSKFWQLVFPFAPKLMYVPLESVVLEYLKGVLKNPQSLFYKIIISNQGRELWKKYFSQEHTFMFWGIDKKGRRQALTVLESENEILNLIDERKIYPSSPLCFMVLLFAGLACAGGFTQTTWLTEVKEKFLFMLKEFQESENIISRIEIVYTKNFAESSLAFIKQGSGLIAPTAADLFLTGKDYYPIFNKWAEKLTLKQSFSLALPTIYQVVVPLKQRDKAINIEQLQNRVFKNAEIAFDYHH